MALPIFLRSGVDEGAAGHPWLRALEAFDVAFVAYSAGGDRVSISAAAARLERDGGARVTSQGDRAVATQLATIAPRMRTNQFTRVGEVTVHDARVTLSIYLGGAASEIAAIVIFHPYVIAPRRAVASGAASLTTREQEVADLVATGLSTKEIAVRMGISVHTARHHTERVFAKLGVRSRAALAALMVR